MNVKVSAIEDRIRRMREKVAEAYLEDDYDYSKVLRLSAELDKLILLDIKAKKENKPDNERI